MHSKQNSCVHVGIIVRSRKGCKHIVQWSSGSSSVSTSSSTESGGSWPTHTSSKWSLLCVTRIASALITHLEYSSPSPTPPSLVLSGERNDPDMDTVSLFWSLMRLEARSCCGSGSGSGLPSGLWWRPVLVLIRFTRVLSA